MRNRPTAAFSLIELLVTIGIVAMLVAILLPIITHVRAASRTAFCLANLQQWGQAYNIYLTANRGQMAPPPNGNDPHHQEWYEFLQSAGGKSKLNLICPEAPPGPPQVFTPGNSARGTAHAAWEVLRRIPGRTFCSYGFNIYVYSKPAGYTRDYGATKLHQAEQIPLLGDCCTVRPAPTDENGVPGNLENPHTEPGDLGLGDYCINRHTMAINMVFIDGHAETIPLAGLWKLRWSSKFKPRDVAVVLP